MLYDGVLRGGLENCKIFLNAPVSAKALQNGGLGLDRPQTAASRKPLARPAARLTDLRSADNIAALALAPTTK